MAKTIHDYLTLSVSDLRRLGYLKNNTVMNGGVKWKRGGHTTATVGVYVDTRAVPLCYLCYSRDGEQITEKIRLMFKHSNLNPEGRDGYYYFVCPVTGSCCRKLYYVGGRFVGRSAFRALYPKQAMSKRQRAEAAYYEALLLFDEIQGSRYRKDHYRGKPTPYRLRMEKHIRRNIEIDPLFKRFNELLETER